MSFTFSIMEFMLLIFGAIVVGITIHLFITNRNSRKEVINGSDEWKLKYLNEMESRDKEITNLHHRLRESEEKAMNLTSKSEELRQRNKELESITEKLEKKAAEMESTGSRETGSSSPATVVPMLNKSDYLDQLLFAQSRLMEQNEKINQLLANLENIREKEEKQRQILRDNADLTAKIDKIKGELTDKEKEIDHMKQKEHLTKDMASMLDVAYSEFNALQLKIQQLESKLISSKSGHTVNEDTKEEYSRLIKEVEEFRIKTTVLTNENRQLQLELTEIKNKLNESNFHKQQLQKRVHYLEELNADLQLVAEANKKLEGQLKQIGKLESMMNTITEENPGVIRPQGNGM